MITRILQYFHKVYKQNTCWHKFYWVNTHGFCASYRECEKCEYNIW